MKLETCWSALLGVALTAPALAQTPSSEVPPQKPPIKTQAHAARPAAARIHRYRVDDAGVLNITYADGVTQPVPPESGSYVIDNEVVPQAAFSAIQVAADRQHIGWVAEYAMCPQSYPCAMEVAVLQRDAAVQRLSPPHGIVWHWAFWRGGRQLALHYGFAHGDDTGEFLLFDLRTGRQIASFHPGRGPAPDWVRALLKSAPP